VGATIEGARVFFLPLLLGANKDREEKRGVKAPELHQGGNTLRMEKKTAGIRGKRIRQRRREGGNDPYGTPNGTDSSQAEGAKKDFWEGSKKTKILLGC